MKAKKNPLKFQSTFSDGGQGVIKSLEKYIKSHPEDADKVSELLKYLKDECTETTDQGPESIHWLISIINKRDTVAHFRKHEYFAFQINYIGEKKNIISPMFTRNQTILESLEIAYDNLLIFIQDFIALLLIPYLDKKLKAYTFRKEDVIDDAPKWYLQLGDLSPQSILQNTGILSFIKKNCDDKGKRLTPEYCENMYLHYASFYKGNNFIITSKGVKIHNNN